MRTTTVDVLFVHSTLRDPKTGERLPALGFGKRGPIWPMLGGSGEDEDPEGDDEDDDGGTGDDDPEKKPEDKKPGDGKKTGKTFDEAYVKKLRDEAASSRTQHTALKTTLDAINAALNPDAKKGDKADPTKLAEQLAARETALRETTVENAVLKAAPRNGADGPALTDSREFMRKVNALDPADEKFATKVADAIKKAVTDNPRYAATTGPRKSGGPIPNGGGGNGGKPTNLTDAIAAGLAARANG